MKARREELYYNKELELAQVDLKLLRLDVAVPPPVNQSERIQADRTPRVKFLRLEGNSINIYINNSIYSLEMLDLGILWWNADNNDLTNV